MCYKELFLLFIVCSKKPLFLFQRDNKVNKARDELQADQRVGSGPHMRGDDAVVVDHRRRSGRLLQVRGLELLRQRLLLFYHSDHYW